MSTSPFNVILSGLGGQGILFMTKILARAALDQGSRIMGAETHGMAQRGGSVVSHLRMGDVQGSMVRAGSAHLLLSLDENEAYRNLAFLGRGASLFSNVPPGHSFPRDKVKDYLEALKISCHAFPASDLAMEMGSPMSANLALLGFFCAFQDGPFPYPAIRQALEEVSPERFRTSNLQVLEAGYARGNP